MARQFGSNQTRGYRQITAQPITQDLQLMTIDVPRGPHIESIYIRCAGLITITTTFTAVRGMSIWRYLRRVDFVLNSNVTLDSVSGTQLAQLMYATRRNLPVVLAPAGFGVSAQSFNVTFILDRALMDMIRPKDSLLKTDVGVANLQLRLQWGALSDFFTGAGVANYSGGISVNVGVADYQEARDDKGNTPSPFYYVKRSGIYVIQAAAGSSIQQKLNTGNRLRIVAFQTLNNATQEPDNTILSRLRLKRAGDTRVDLAASMLRDSINNAAYGPPLPFVATYTVDLANNGQLGVKYTEFWPIPSSADTFLEYDTTAAAQLDFAVLEGVDL